MAKSKQEYYQKQARARDLAIEWQYNFANQKTFMAILHRMASKI